jgi:hypothetical protein
MVLRKIGYLSEAEVEISVIPTRAVDGGNVFSPNHEFIPFANEEH